MQHTTSIQSAPLLCAVTQPHCAQQQIIHSYLPVLAHTICTVYLPKMISNESKASNEATLAPATALHKLHTICRPLLSSCWQLPHCCLSLLRSTINRDTIRESLGLLLKVR